MTRRRQLRSPCPNNHKNSNRNIHEFPQRRLGMNRLSLTVTIVLFAGATAAQAQFGSGVVFDPTQSAHATHPDRERRQIPAERSHANRERNEDLYQHRQDRDHSFANLQHCSSAVHPLPPDDELAEYALSVVSFAPQRPDADAANLQHIRQFDGVAQCVEYGNRERRLRISKRLCPALPTWFPDMGQRAPSDNSRSPRREPPSTSAIP